LEVVLVAAGAALASFLSGLLGLGGGVVIAPFLLYVPALVGAAPLGVKLITGLTAVQACSASLVGTLRHRGHGNVSLPTIRVMGPAIGVSALAGAYASAQVDDRILVAIFAAIAAASAAALVIPARGREASRADLKIDPRVALPISVVLGFVLGLVGFGGAAFIMTVLIHVFRLPVRLALGTSLGIGLFAAIAALLGKAATAQVDPGLGAVVLLSALLFSPIGVAVSVRTRERALTYILAAILTAAAARIAWTAVTGA
jgi:uncharacterized membrane protein YfcA